MTVCAYIGYNAVIFKRPSLSPSGQSFFMANLIEYGPARSYLEEACPHAGFRICPYIEKLPATAEEFLWRQGPFTKLGRFSGMENEADKIVIGTLTHKPLAVAAMTARNFLAALATHKPGAELTPSAFPVWSSIGAVVEGKFGYFAIERLRDSAQMRGTIPYRLIEAIDSIVAPLSLAGAFILGGLALRARRRDLVVPGGLHGLRRTRQRPHLRDDFRHS